MKNLLLALLNSVAMLLCGVALSVFIIFIIAILLTYPIVFVIVVLLEILYMIL